MVHLHASVIIPTFQDWARLQTCLNALAAQTLPQDAFEVIIANNDPATPLPDTFAIPQNARIIDVIEPGSYAARNAALQIAEGPILAFTDADCIPDPQWLTEAIAFFDAQPEIQRMAGSIHLFVEDGIWTAAALYDRTYMLRQDKFVSNGKAATANAFMRREVFDSVGPFDPKLLTGGDHEWSMRAAQARYALGYCPAAAVRHPARSRFTQLLRKARRFAGGAIASKRAKGQRIILPHFDNLLFPIRRGVLLLRSDDLTLWQAIRVWAVLYAIRIVIVGEQVRLTVFRGEAERR